MTVKCEFWKCKGAPLKRHYETQEARHKWKRSMQGNALDQLDKLPETAKFSLNSEEYDFCHVPIIRHF